MMVQRDTKQKENVTPFAREILLYSSSLCKIKPTELQQYCVESIFTEQTPRSKETKKDATAFILRNFHLKLVK